VTPVKLFQDITGDRGDDHAYHDISHLALLARVVDYCELQAYGSDMLQTFVARIERCYQATITWSADTKPEGVI